MTLLDEVIYILDLIERGELAVFDRVSAATLAEHLEAPELEVEAALYALVTANLVGEGPPAGYYWTDARDPAFKERNP
jgi:hypothetical protein